MSAEKNIEGFVEKLMTDESIRAEIESATQGKSEGEALKAVVAIGEKNGYRFTSSEAADLRQGALCLAEGSGELSEKQLESVAGGFSPAFWKRVSSYFAVSKTLASNSASGLVGNSGAGLVRNSASGLVGNSGAGLVGNSGAGLRTFSNW